MRNDILCFCNSLDGTLAYLKGRLVIYISPIDLFIISSFNQSKVPFVIFIFLFMTISRYNPSKGVSIKCNLWDIYIVFRFNTIIMLGIAES